MSTTWVRAPLEWWCCHCDELRPKGAPQFQIRLTNVERTLYRCERCAWEPVPKDLPERPPPAARGPLPMVRFSAGMLPIDWKISQTGEREPGEDDE